MSTTVLILAVVLLALLRGWFLWFPGAQVRSVWLKIVLLLVLGAVAGFAWWTEPPDNLSPPLRIAPIILALAIVTIFMLPRGILKEEQKKSVIEMLDTLVIAGVTALFLIMFVVRPFFIPSQSMQHTLEVDDMVLVNELAYRFGTPSRGDIVVFKPPADSHMGDKDLIKRIVAVGGDTLEIRGGVLRINGKFVEEPFINRDRMMEVAVGKSVPNGMYEFGPVTVDPDHVFCMGDNRGNSDDSRDWGQLPTRNIIGKAFIIFWPPSRVGRLR